LVLIDEYLPVHFNKTVFGQGDGEMWVGLMEKAWAKLFGSYARVELGHFSTAYSCLTGKAQKTYWHSDTDIKKHLPKAIGGFCQVLQQG
jgi:hypothetical protein